MQKQISIILPSVAAQGAFVFSGSPQQCWGECQTHLLRLTRGKYSAGAATRPAVEAKSRIMAYSKKHNAIC